MAEYIERKVALAAIRERCAPCGEGIEALKASPRRRRCTGAAREADKHRIR